MSAGDRFGSGKPRKVYHWKRYAEPGKVDSEGIGDMEDGPVAPLPPVPPCADSVVRADVREAWKVYDTMLIASLGDRSVADQEFERVRERKTKRGKHGKRKSKGS